MMRLHGEEDSLSFAKPESLPAKADYTTLQNSYWVEVPADWMEEGLELSINLDGESVYATTPSFGDAINLYMTIVPMVVNGVQSNTPSESELIDTLKMHWPLSEVFIEWREPFIVERPGSELSPSELLHMLRDLYVQEGAQHFYHGFFPLQELGTQDALGIAYLAGRVGITSGRAASNVFAHELGHNFSIGHIACGGPSNVETQFPYSPNTIGSTGISHDFTRTYAGGEYRDLMSYCGPKFISDWVYEKAQDFLTLNPPPSFDSSVADIGMMSFSQPSSSTYLSGFIDQVNNEYRVINHFELSQPAGRGEYGPFMLIATDRQGGQYERRFAIDKMSESTSERNGYFNVRIPAMGIEHVSVFYNGREIFSSKL